jgi:hypothetical protein
VLRLGNRPSPRGFGFIGKLIVDACSSLARGGWRWWSVVWRKQVREGGLCRLDVSQYLPQLRGQLRDLLGLLARGVGSVG